MIAVDVMDPTVVWAMRGVTLATLVALLWLVALASRIILRQRRDIRDGQRVLKAVLDLTVTMEADDRRLRHAVKEMAATMRMQSVVAALERPPDQPPDGGADALVARLVRAAGRVDEEGVVRRQA